MLSKNDGGIAITALWLLALLSLITVGLVRDSVMGLKVDAYAQRAAEARWLARAGVYQAISVLRNSVQPDSASPYHALSQDWAHNSSRFERVSCGTGFFEVGYSRVSPVEQRVVPGLVDENRKININTAPKTVLGRLPGMSESKVAALLDWRDGDSMVRVGGAEAAYYAEHTEYTCKNGALDAIEELLLVKDFTVEDVATLAPWITVYGYGAVNINTAPAAVLTFLGLSQGAAQDIVRLRQGSDGEAMTGDDRVFSSPATLVTDLTQRVHLRSSEQALLHRLVSEGSLGVQSSHFTIQSCGVAVGGKVRQTVVATVAQSGNDSFRIVAWHER